MTSITIMVTIFIVYNIYHLQHMYTIFNIYTASCWSADQTAVYGGQHMYELHRIENSRIERRLKQ